MSSSDISEVFDVTQEFVLFANELLKVHTPEGLVYISTLRGVGTQVLVYSDPEKNPIGTICVDEEQ